jgi:hypothetical protein
MGAKIAFVLAILAPVAIVGSCLVAKLYDSS